MLTLDELRQRLVVSVPDAAEVLGVCRRHAYDLVRDGTLPVILLQSKKKVPVSALLRLVDGAANPPPTTTT